MRDPFVSPSYKHDLRKKLQRLEQGDNSVQEYYAELQKGMIRCGVEEETEDKICRFYGGLRGEIQDIVDYKEFNTVNELFHLASLAEKELQGHEQQSKDMVSTTYTPRSAPSSGLTKPTTFRAPPPASERPAASGVTAAPKVPSAQPSDSGKNSL